MSVEIVKTHCGKEVWVNAAEIFFVHEYTMVCVSMGGQLSIGTQFNNTFWLHIGSKTMTHIQALCVTYVHPYTAVAPKPYL